MTIYDIAKAARVSTATVSRVLNGSPKVTKATRDKVMAVIERDNYVPSAIAQNLSNRNSLKNVGVICYNLEDAYYARAVSLLERPLRERGYNIILVTTGADTENQAKSVSLLLSKHVDAVVLIGSIFVSGESDDHLAAAAKTVPVFIVNGKISAENAYSFYCDDCEAVRSACERLRSLGRTVAYFYDADTYSSRMKLKGFKSFCQAHGFDFDALSVKCPSSVSGAREAFSRFISARPEVNAVVAGSDLLAAGILAAARDEKISVPDDLRVIGYDDSLVCECTHPALTSINNKIELVCERVVAAIADVFDGKQADSDFKATASVTIRET